MTASGAWAVSGVSTWAGSRIPRTAPAMNTSVASRSAQADDILGHVPDTGDTATGRTVDDFVDQAADALRALDEAVAETLRQLEAERS